MNEQSYLEGQKAVYSSLLNECLRNLSNDQTASISIARLVSERADAIAVLRDLCEEFGDNDWPDDLHLADIIEKHLGRALRRRD